MDETKRDCWVGFDLGGTKMLSVVFDEKFKPVARKRRRTKGHDGVKAGLARIVETIEKTLEQGKIDVAQLRGIGVGCPGPLNLDKGVILEAPNLGWTNAPIRRTLEKRFNCPVIIGNDVDLGVYGEYRFGAAQGARCTVGIFPGTGVGGGCVYEGRIFRGRVSSCMEVGFMRLTSDGRRAGICEGGTLEAVASRLAISAEAAKAVFRGQAPNLRKLAGTDLSGIRSGMLAEAIRLGDKVIEEIVVTAGGYLGMAIANLVNLMAPDIVVLGGGLVEAMPKLYLAAVEKNARNGCLPTFRDTFKIRAARLGDDTTVLGAAAWIAENVAGGHAQAIPDPSELESEARDAAGLPAVDAEFEFDLSESDAAEATVVDAMLEGKAPPDTPAAESRAETDSTSDTRPSEDSNNE